MVFLDKASPDVDDCVHYGSALPPISYVAGLIPFEKVLSTVHPDRSAIGLRRSIRLKTSAISSVDLPDVMKLKQAPNFAPVPSDLCEADAVHLIRGASLFTAKTHRDARGELLALEQDSNLGFALQRVYCIRVDSSAAIRAEHACSAQQVIVALAGAVTIDLDNGNDRNTLRLMPGGSALRIQAGIWLRLRGFLKGTILLISASRTYADTAYYDKPQPELIAAA
jgi:hypothetical protein